MWPKMNQSLLQVLCLCALFNLYSTARSNGQMNRWDEERLGRIRQIVYSGVSNLTSQLLLARGELTGREEDSTSKVSQSMSGHLLQNWMKIVSGEQVEKPNEIDRAFAYTIESLNETLPQVIQELYLASGTMPRQQDLSGQPQFYQGPVEFITAAVFGVVFYEMVRSIPSVIHRTSNWMRETQESLAFAVDRLIHNHPEVINQTDSTPLLYKDMGFNPVYFKNFSVTPDFVKNLFRY